MDQLREIPDFEQTCRLIHDLDSIITQNETLGDELDGQAIHFALYKNGWLTVFNVRALGDQHELEQAVESALPGVTSANGLKLTGHRLYFKLYNGIGILSSQQLLIEKCVDASRPKWINSQCYSLFQEELPESGKASVYLNNDLRRQEAGASLLYQSGCLAGAVEILPSELRVSGTLVAPRNEALQLLSGRDPGSTEDLMQEIPAAASAFTCIVRPPLNVVSEQARHFWQMTNEKALYHAHQEFAGIVSPFLSRLMINGKAVISIGTTDSTKAKSILASMGDSSSRHRFIRTHTFCRLFEPWFSDTIRFACWENDQFMFSGDSMALSSCMQQFNNEQWLYSNKIFRDYSVNNFPSSFNVLIYESPGQPCSLLGPECLRLGMNPRHTSLSLINDKTGFAFRLQTEMLQEEHAGDQPVLWSFNADADIAMQPHQFVNHKTSEKEIILQDVNHQLYLINGKGNLIWKKQLDEPIMSGIVLVDLFKNNKRQMVFNTEKAIYAIDRKGQMVDGFPIRLPAKATSPVSVIDYDQDRNYRLLISCSDKKIYNFGSNGKPTDGFVNVTTKAEVVLPVEYVKNVDKSDYLVTADVAGNIYTFSRKGAGRIGLAKKVFAGSSELLADADGHLAETRLYSFDRKERKIRSVTFTNKSEDIRIQADDDINAARFQVIDENRVPELLVASGQDVTAFSVQGVQLFSEHFPNAVSDFLFFQNEAYNCLFALDRGSSMVYVRDLQNKKDRSFKSAMLPLVTDLFGNHKTYVVVTAGKVVNCFSLQ